MHARAWIVSLCIPLVVALLAQPLLADEKDLFYDDDAPDGPKSFGGSAHVIRFDAPAEGGWSVDRAEVCASGYGGGFDPATTFARLYVCDLNMQVLGEAQVAYNVFPFRSQTQDWGTIDVPCVPVSGGFYIIFAPGSQQTRGLYVAYDSTGKNAGNVHSGSGTPGNQPKPVDQPYDWMIRCHITTDCAGVEAEATGEMLSWDDGTADDKQSFGGTTGMVVRFDPPAGEGVIDAIHLYAMTYGRGEGAMRTGFTLAIADADQNLLSFAMYPYALVTSDAHWVRVDLLPDVPVKGPFYVTYVGNCMQTDGIYLGIDTTKGSGQSYLGTPGQLTDWSFRLPQNQVNWMIRAELKKE